MNRKHIVTVGAVLLTAVGVACIVYAAAALRRANQPLTLIQPPLKSLESGQAREAMPTKDVVPGGETGHQRPDKESLWRLLRHWLLLALLLVVVLVVALLALRRLRPSSLRRRRLPSDMTDLWQEAGRRLK